MDDLPQTLVRSYSSDLHKREAAHQSQLERIVGSKEQLRQHEEREWRAYFERWNPSEAELEEAFLRKEGMYLMKAWKEFTVQFPEETSSDLKGRAPGVTEVIKTVMGVCSSWDGGRKQGKWGKAKQYLHGFCNGLNNHATLLELLPSGSEYVSLFTGSIASIVKASVNHEKVATEISKSLNEITDMVADCVEMCQLYNTEKVQMRIAMMYAHIFLFLNDAMMWCRKKSWRRLLDSFNEHFYDDFEDKILNIRKFAEKVKQQARMGLSAEQRATRLAVEQIKSEFADMRLWASGKAREGAETAEAVRSSERKNTIEIQQKKALLIEGPERRKSLATWIGTRMVEMLEMRATDWMETENTKVQITAGRASPEPSLPASFPLREQHELATPMGREEFLEATRDLELYFSRDQIRLPFDLPPTVGVASRVSHRLQDFVTATHEPYLAIAGPRSLDHQGLSVMTKVAASFLQYADEARLPVISWFCELPTSNDVYEGASVEMTALVSLVYALIRQLVEILPLKPEARIDVNMKSLETLDGTSASIATAIQLLQDLLKQMDSPLFIVVDGLQWLDDVSTDQDLGDCIVALTRASASTHREDDDTAPAVRILFTTTGRSRALLDVLDTTACLLADEGGHSRKGTGGTSLAW